MVSKIPLILETLSNQSGSSVLEECFEFLYLVSTTSVAGVMVLYKSGSLKTLTSWMSTFSDGSYLMKISMQLIQLILSKISLDNIIIECLPELSVIVVAIARQFGVSHDAMKFEALHLLSAILSSNSEHGQRKGDDILASVWVIGSYLAQTPDAWTEKVKELLEYMLSVEGEYEQSPFNSVCFLLPMLCQITMNVEECKTLVSSGGLAAVVNCLINLIHKHGGWIDDDGSIFLACDTVLNVLLKKELAGLVCGESSFVHLLEAIANSTEDADEPSVIVMAASICALIFDFTSDNALLSKS